MKSAGGSRRVSRIVPHGTWGRTEPWRSLIKAASHADQLIYSAYQRLHQGDDPRQLIYWRLNSLSTGSLYLSPEGNRSVILYSRLGRVGHFSADAAGIVATMDGFWYIADRYPRAARLAEKLFWRLRDYTGRHPEAGEIMRFTS